MKVTSVFFLFLFLFFVAIVRVQLYVHGLCHLIGHDHVQDDEFERMQTVEDRVLKCMRDEGIEA